MKITSITISLLFTLAAFGAGGGWVGSGGELFRDAHNPWFLRNTTNVSYCIQLDKETVSADLKTSEKAIKTGLMYWQKELNQSSAMPQAGHFVLGGQIFVQEECSSATDLRFLFGHGTLSEKEIKFLKRPEKYVGITVRTAYDEVNLKGKGFIYIASDRGPHAYDNPGHYLKKAWQHEKLLTYALIHELGHMFGIPHTGNGIMSEVFLDQFLTKTLVDNFIKLPFESFLHPKEELTTCLGVTRKSRRFFAMDTSHQCLIMKILNSHSPTAKWDVYAKINEADLAGTLLGSIVNIRPELFDYRGRPASILQITKKQKVFTPIETAFRTFMVGPMILDTGAKGVFISRAGGIPKNVYLRMTNSTVTILGSQKNKVEPVYIYNSPLGILRLISPIP